jgi:hypothetical protein
MLDEITSEQIAQTLHRNGSLCCINKRHHLRGCYG